MQWYHCLWPDFWSCHINNRNEEKSLNKKNKPYPHLNMLVAMLTVEWHKFLNCFFLFYKCVNHESHCIVPGRQNINLYQYRMLDEILHRFKPKLMLRDLYIRTPRLILLDYSATLYYYFPARLFFSFLTNSVIYRKMSQNLQFNCI